MLSYTPKNSLAGLLEFVDLNEIPAEYGGTSPQQLGSSADEVNLYRAVRECEYRGLRCLTAHRFTGPAVLMEPLVFIVFDLAMLSILRFPCIPISVLCSVFFFTYFLPS
jgi:hypothetical protein